MLRIIVITDTPFMRSEADTVSMLLDEGVERVHLRKPGSDESDMRRLIEGIDPRLYPRLTLQDHLPLAAEYGIGGVHLNARNKSVPDSFGGLVSRSCHTFDELSRCTGEDYMFLSPLFDSISKRGYRAAFTAATCRSPRDNLAARGGAGRHRTATSAAALRPGIRRSGLFRIYLADAVAAGAAAAHSQNSKLH